MALAAALETLRQAATTTLGARLERVLVLRCRSPTKLRVRVVGVDAHAFVVPTLTRVATLDGLCAATPVLPHACEASPVAGKRKAMRTKQVTKRPVHSHPATDMNPTQTNHATSTNNSATQPPRAYLAQTGAIPSEILEHLKAYIASVDRRVQARTLDWASVPRPPIALSTSARRRSTTRTTAPAAMLAIRPRPR